MAAVQFSDHSSIRSALQFLAPRRTHSFGNQMDGYNDNRSHEWRWTAENFRKSSYPGGRIRSLASVECSRQSKGSANEMNDETSEGTVYVLTNPAMKEVKIGYTSKTVPERMDQLFTTGVPFPFKCAKAVKVRGAKGLESAIHKILYSQKANPTREFFSVEPEETFALLDWVCENAGGEDVTPQSATASNVDEAAAEAYNKRRPVFDFHALEIPDGSELTFKDDTTKKATVSGPKKVIFEGEETTLTPLTKRLLGVENAVRPSPYWIFDGELLINIYNEYHAEVGRDST